MPPRGTPKKAAQTEARSFKDVLMAPSPAAKEPSAAPASSSEDESGVSWKAFFCLFLTVNLVASMYNHIDDTDETFGYWEPLHYLTYGRGMQTWEYAPQFAIRTYAFIAPLLPLAWLLKQLLLKVEVFHFVRFVLGAQTAYAEATFLRAVQAKQGTAAMRLTAIFLLFSPGVLQAATAFLPSAVIMSFVMLSAAAWLSSKPLACIWWGCCAVLLTGWPYVGVVFLPLGLHALHSTSRMQGLGGAARLTVGGLGLACGTALLAALIDRYYYGVWTFPSLNALRYNAGGSGDNLYGTEPAGYYVRNLFLTMGLAWPLGAVAPVLLLREYIEPAVQQDRGGKYAARAARSAVLAVSTALWLALLFSRPHKEERFMYPIYPLLAYCASVSAVGFVDIVGSVAARLLRESPPLLVEQDFEELSRISDIASIPERDDKMSAALQRRRTWGYGIKTAAMAVCICGSITLCCLRVGSLQTNYGGYLSMWQDISNLLPLPPAGKSSPKTHYTLCVGSEWYRFSSHFHLPEPVSLAFVKDTFGGQLPQVRGVRRGRACHNADVRTMHYALCLLGVLGVLCDV